MPSDINKIIELIQKSALDKTIKDILIRDLKTDGLTDFLKEQIKAYCLEARKELREEYQSALAILNSKSGNPSA